MCDNTEGLMPRSIWTGAISFGLVNIPVRLYSAVQPKELHFHMLHAKDGGRIQMKRVCSLDRKEVPYEAISKGYEIRKGQYVMIDPEELEAFDPKSTHTIDIEDFVELSEIDPIYYETSYYLAPDKRAGKAYTMLLRALQRTGKVAIARIVLRTKQHLCAVRVVDELLMLSTMQYADEIVQSSDLDVPKPDEAPRSREVAMAEQLIESLTSPFRPERYHDEYREKVLDLIQRKARGEKIITAPTHEEVEVSDLAEALAASLGQSRRATPKTGSRRAPTERAAAARTRRATRSRKASSTKRTRKGRARR